jgi:hypothetical protein
VINIRQKLRCRKGRQTYLTFFFAIALVVKLFTILFTERSSVTMLFVLVTEPADRCIMRTVFAVLVTMKGGLVVLVGCGRGGVFDFSLSRRPFLHWLGWRGRLLLPLLLLDLDEEGLPLYISKCLVRVVE